MTFYELLVEWSEWAWPLLANHLWQATLFALLILIVSSSLKRAPARVRHTLWLVVLAKFALPSAAVVWLVKLSGVDITSTFAAGSNSLVNTSSLAPLLSPVASRVVVQESVEPLALDLGAAATAVDVAATQNGHYFYLALSLCWIAGCLLLLCLFFRRRRHLSEAVRAGMIVTEGRELSILKRVQSWLGVRRKVLLVISPQIKEPGVWRIFRPIVVLPEGITALLDDKELEAVMMHELVHVERWDNLVSILQRAVCCLLWFHPLVWLLDRRLIAEREQSCDDAVIKLGGAAQAYASSITKVCRHSIGWQMTGLSNMAVSNLKQRLTRIVAADTNRSPSLLHRGLIVTAVLLVIIISAAAGKLDDHMLAVHGVTGGSHFIDSRFEVPDTAEAENAATTEASTNISTSLQTPTTNSSPLLRKSSGAHVEVRSEAETLATTIVGLVSTVMQPAADTAPPQADVPQPSQPAPSAVIIPASAETSRGDLREYIGRYEVDPTKVENFVLDITLEYGELYLKPSHAAKRKLMRASGLSFTDIHSDFRLTFIRGVRGGIVAVRLDSWDDDLTARKLALPQPSLTGNKTFRLKGFPDAKIVAVAGTFNNWNQSQLLFAREGDEWVCRVQLPRGRHQYKFIVDGNWITDPSNPQTEEDGRGHTNSLLSAE